MDPDRPSGSIIQYLKTPITRTAPEISYVRVKRCVIMAWVVIMALIKTTNDIVSIRGRLGGVYFKAGSPGTHIQAMPRHVNYNRTGLQGDRRSGFSGLAGFWWLALVAGFYTAWGLYAYTHDFIKEGRPAGKVSAYNWFINYGMICLDNGSPPYWHPPHHPGDLPFFMAIYRGNWSYHIDQKDWPWWNPGGYYYRFGVYNGHDYFTVDPHTWFLWYKGPMWVISPYPGLEPDTDTWYNTRLGGGLYGHYRSSIREFDLHVYYGSPESLHEYPLPPPR